MEPARLVALRFRFAEDISFDDGSRPVVWLIYAHHLVVLFFRFWYHSFFKYRGCMSQSKGGKCCLSTQTPSPETFDVVVFDTCVFALRLLGVLYLPVGIV